jgi:hypothetical protein
MSDIETKSRPETEPEAESSAAARSSVLETKAGAGIETAVVSRASGPKAAKKRVRTRQAAQQMRHRGC